MQRKNVSKNAKRTLVAILFSIYGSFIQWGNIDFQECQHEDKHHTRRSRGWRRGYVHHIFWLSALPMKLSIVVQQVICGYDNHIQRHIGYFVIKKVHLYLSRRKCRSASEPADTAKWKCGLSFTQLYTDPFFTAFYFVSVQYEFNSDFTCAESFEEHLG